jgi:hypothetical protein
MGNCFSTRWDTTIVRQDTDPLPKLDVRLLHRMGALRSGAVAMPSWLQDEALASQIITAVDPVSPDVLILECRVQHPGGDWYLFHEQVPLTTTPCTFGGKRIWFRCPGCYGRRAVLFCFGGRFRCRKCHNLAYTSTREREWKRSMRRVAKLRVKIDNEDEGTDSKDNVDVSQKSFMEP